MRTINMRWLIIVMCVLSVIPMSFAYAELPSIRFAQMAGVTNT